MRDLVDTHIDQPAVFEVLEKAVDYFDEMKTLPVSHWVRRDKESAEKDILKLIKEAIEVLDVPGLVELRKRYRKVEGKVGQEKTKLAELRQRRMMAPNTRVGLLTRVIPTDTLKGIAAKTRGDYDLLIKSHEKNIDAYYSTLLDMREAMSRALGLMNIMMPPDQMELWLSSAIGEDVIAMSTVFESVRQMMLWLEELTQENEENLEFSKRYYGMLVILHKLVIHMQESFVVKIDNEVLPKLASFEREANALISSSQLLMRKEKNARLQKNIDANRLTKNAIVLYRKVVAGQRKKVVQALIVSRREEKVAANTYRTVVLSANVAMLIRDGIHNFEILANLQVPDATEFQNVEMREEFARLTERLKSDE